ncbi:MAG: hypothetical protein JST50_01440 [Bacteroidetes bacterium]|jgi:hypothetical protein|nr:hypothetical protein [Bacteroidota bacterium]
MRTNIIGKSSLTVPAVEPKPSKRDGAGIIPCQSEINLVKVWQYNEYVQIDYLAGAKQMQVKVALDKLMEFTIEKWHDYARPGDITVYDFIDENLIGIIEAYLAAGKETLS